MNVMNRIGQVLRRAALRSTSPILLWACDKRIVCGFEVIFLPDLEKQIAFDKIAEAIELIAQFDPLSLAHIRRYIKRMHCTPLGSNVGEFHWDLNACALDPDYLRHSSALDIALTILHETVHARLDNLGIRDEESSRYRVGQLCVKTERSFLERFRQTPLAAEAASMELTVHVNSNHSRRVNNATKLRQLGFPDWLSKLV